MRKKEGSRARPGMEDLLGASRLSYGADAILFLEAGAATKAAPNTDSLILRVAKGRDGASRSEVALVFEYTCSRFQEQPPVK
jgi:hypothetical protein